MRNGVGNCSSKTGSQRQSDKKTILKHFLKGILKGKLLAPKLRKSADKSLSQPGCSHCNTIYDLQLQKTIVLRMQPRHQATLTQPFTLRERSYSCKAQWNSIGNSSTSTTCNPIYIGGTILELQITMEFCRPRMHEKHLKHHLQWGTDPTMVRDRSAHDPTTHETVSHPSHRRGRSSTFGDALWDFLQNSIGNSSTSTTCNPIYIAGTILQLQMTMEFCRPHMHEKHLKPNLQCGTDPTMVRDRSAHDPTTHETGGVGLLHVSDSQEERDQEELQYTALHDFVVTNLLAESCSDITLWEFKKVYAQSSNKPNASHQTAFKELKTRKMMQKGCRKGKAKDVLQPVISCEVGFEDVIFSQRADEERVFPESMNTGQIRKYLEENPCRNNNVYILKQFFTECLTEEKRKKGRPAADDHAKKQTLQDQLCKLETYEKVCQNLVEIACPEAASQPAQTPLRRSRAKQPPAQVAPATGLVETSVRYKYSGDRKLRGRLVQPKLLPRNARGGFKPNSLIIQLIWTLRTVALRLSCNCLKSWNPTHLCRRRHWKLFVAGRTIVGLYAGRGYRYQIATARSWLQLGFPEGRRTSHSRIFRLRGTFRGRPFIFVGWHALFWPKITKNWRQEATSRIQERRHSSTCGRAWKMLCWKPGLTSCFWSGQRTCHCISTVCGSTQTSLRTLMLWFQIVKTRSKKEPDSVSESGKKSTNILWKLSPV